MNLRTEKAIKAWLKLPKDERLITCNHNRGTIRLYKIKAGIYNIVAQFTLKSIVAKRLPARKKKGKR